MTSRAEAGESGRPARPAPRRTRRAVLTAVGTVLALAGSLGTAAAVPTAPDTRAARNAAPADGVWRMDGYGLFVTVSGGVLRTWDTTALSCLPGLTATRQGAPGPGGEVRFGSPEAVLIVRQRGTDRATLAVDGGVGTRDMRRVPALPELCGRAPATGPLANFDVFWQTFEENYAFFAARGVDWDAVRAKYRPKVTARTTPAELFDILAEMTAPLQDGHVALEADTPELTRSARVGREGTVAPSPEYDERVREFIERRDFGGVPLESHANGAIGYGELPGGIGYLRINRFTWYTPDAPVYQTDAAELTKVLDRIVTRARTSGPGAWRGLIVDIRVNAGGMDQLGLSIASRLTDRSYQAYAKQARNDPRDDTRFTRRQTIGVVPAAGVPRYTGPIALLTGGSTVSAGETFTQALSERPSTVRIGANTQGIFSDVLGRTLPNGWKFSLSNERYTNPRGRSFEGPGIAPHVRTPVFTEKEFAAGRDSAFDRAKALLNARS
ncbi:S41 family peptidase [Streptomyces uncialis]|uniref:S41 family peptidase n=1 Tax=Streptomyces uncialis TaxID=1048205 RepID=UPI001FE9A01B|nr:S41 family peptidase [Streptomyces uncialis]